MSQRITISENEYIELRDDGRIVLNDSDINVFTFASLKVLISSVRDNEWQTLFEQTQGFCESLQRDNEILKDKIFRFAQILERFDMANYKESAMPIYGKYMEHFGLEQARDYSSPSNGLRPTMKFKDDLDLDPIIDMYGKEAVVKMFEDAKPVFDGDKFNGILLTGTPNGIPPLEMEGTILVGAKFYLNDGTEMFVAHNQPLPKDYVNMSDEGKLKDLLEGHDTNDEYKKCVSDIMLFNKTAIHTDKDGNVSHVPFSKIPDNEQTIPHVIGLGWHTGEAIESTVDRTPKTCKGGFIGCSRDTNNDGDCGRCANG